MATSNRGNLFSLLKIIILLYQHQEVIDNFFEATLM